MVAKRAKLRTINDMRLTTQDPRRIFQMMTKAMKMKNAPIPGLTEEKREVDAQVHEINLVFTAKVENVQDDDSIEMQERQRYEKFELQHPPRNP